MMTTTMVRACLVQSLRGAEQVEQGVDVGLRELQRVVLGESAAVSDERHDGAQLVVRGVQRRHATPLSRVRHHPSLHRSRRRRRRRVRVLVDAIPVGAMTQRATPTTTTSFRFRCRRSSRGWRLVIAACSG